eukprot:1101305-Prorocentrum_minimum.AAC.2
MVVLWAKQSEGSRYFGVFAHMCKTCLSVRCIASAPSLIKSVTIFPCMQSIYLMRFPRGMLIHGCLDSSRLTQLRNWDKRWFALDNEQFMYATSAKDKQAKQRYSVSDIQDVRLVEGDDEKERRFEFEVIFPGRVLRLRPYSESQRRHWVDTLQRVLDSQIGVRDSGFDRVLESHSGEAIPSVVADKLRKGFFRRKIKRPSVIVDEIKAKCEKRFLKPSVDDGITSLRNSYKDDPSPSSEISNPFGRPEGVVGNKGKWTAEIEQGECDIDASFACLAVSQLMRCYKYMITTHAIRLRIHSALLPIKPIYVLGFCHIPPNEWIPFVAHSFEKRLHGPLDGRDHYLRKGLGR